MWKPRVTGSDFFSYEKAAGSSQLGRNLTQLHGRTEVWMVSARRALFQSTPSPDLHGGDLLQKPPGSLQQQLTGVPFL